MSDPLSPPPTGPIRPTGTPATGTGVGTGASASTPGSSTPAASGSGTGTSGQAGRSGKPGRSDKRAAQADDPLRRSRVSGLWIATVTAGVLLILLIIFVVQNTQSVEVRFLGWKGTPPLAVALLVAAAAGILVTGLFGTLRIFQLRRRVKRAAS